MQSAKQAVKYISKPPNKQGFVAWDQGEDQLWSKLMKIQNEKMPRVACQEYLDGLKLIKLPEDRMPQLPEVSEVLMDKTGWQVWPVPCLINFGKFFKLLSERKFPCATFLRTPEEMLYLQEPDIFHEIYGHCPLLTNKHFADFTARYGRLGLKATPKDRVYLARLYWFTVEFGLIKPKNQNMRIYGGGILSSIGETEGCLTDKVEARRFDMVDALRTPYRIDIEQPIYYYLEDLQELSEMTDEKILKGVEKAKVLGMFKPTFPPKPKKVNCEEAPASPMSPQLAM